MATVKQYNWKLEQMYRTGTPGTRVLTGTNNVSNHPEVGNKWRYYSVETHGLDDTCAETAGKVVSYDEKSGVITTDADEVLLRG